MNSVDVTWVSNTAYCETEQQILTNTDISAFTYNSTFDKNKAHTYKARPPYQSSNFFEYTYNSNETNLNPIPIAFSQFWKLDLNCAFKCASTE